MKKAIALTAAAILAMGMMTGCNGKTNGTDKTQTGSQTMQNAAEDVKDTVTGNNAGKDMTTGNNAGKDMTTDNNAVKDMATDNNAGKERTTDHNTGKDAATGNNKADTASFIGVEKVKEVALKKAGITAEGVTFDKVELDEDNGVWLYEVKMKKDRTEYEAEIKADNGDILKWKVEKDG